MKLLSEILVAAKELISEPENWTKGAWARNKGGTRESVGSSSATCFCIIGAAVRVSRCKDTAFMVSQLSTDKLNEWCAGYNDNHTHPEVMCFMDRLIEAARIEEAK